MNCVVSGIPRPDVDPTTVAPYSEGRRGNEKVPNRIKYTVSVDIGFDSEKWDEWSRGAVAALQNFAVKRSSSTWKLSQSEAPRVDSKSGDGSGFLGVFAGKLSPEVQRLTQRLLQGTVERREARDKSKRAPGEKPRTQRVAVNAMEPLASKVTSFAGWTKGQRSEETSVCISIQTRDGAAVQHFLMPSGCKPGFDGLAGNDRVPVIELILKDRDGNPLPIHWGDKRPPWLDVETFTSYLWEEHDRWYLASPRLLVANRLRHWLVSSPSMTYEVDFELDQEVAVRLSAAEARLVSGRYDNSPPGAMPSFGPTEPIKAPQLPSATPPGMSPPSVPPVPRAPGPTKFPGIPRAVPRG
jgi:hypothetical protein